MGGSCRLDHVFEPGANGVATVQYVAVGLALFASLVAPFGGFFASAVKRAFKIKDFAGFIPGHGGITDRMDCQMIMTLCSWITFTTFVSNPQLVESFDYVVEVVSRMSA